MKPALSLVEAQSLAVWRRPKALLYVFTAMPLSFAVWSALLNNFAIEVVHLTARIWDGCTQC